jgi:hypothetical protein
MDVIASILQVRSSATPLRGLSDAIGLDLNDVIGFQVARRIEPGAGLAQQQRVVLIAPVQNIVISILDMQAYGRLKKPAAEPEIPHLAHGVARTDDVEAQIEHVLGNGHMV